MSSNIWYIINILFIDNATIFVSKIICYEEFLFDYLIYLFQWFARMGWRNVGKGSV